MKKDMCRFKIRFIIAFLTFGMGIFGASFLLNKISPKNLTKSDSARVGRTVEDWQLPIPTEKKFLTDKIANLSSADGNTVAVTITDYESVGEFLTETPLHLVRLNMLFGLCQIDRFSEYKVKDKIFGYWMFAHTVTLNERTGKQSNTRTDFIYRYIDSDGDGTFETNVPGESELVVPVWATQYPVQ